MGLGDYFPSYILGPEAEEYTPLAHAPTLDAELEALERLRKNPGGVHSNRAKVLRTMCEHGDWPLTRIEVAKLMGTTRDHVHPRMMELEKGGWVERIGTGRTGVQYIPTPKGMAWARQERENEG
jgi:hypothetical protein